jgi:hypothetical protein
MIVYVGWNKKNIHDNTKKKKKQTNKNQTQTSFINGFTSNFMNRFPPPTS